MIRALLMAAAAPAALLACAPSVEDAGAELAAGAAESCPDDGPRFPETGICVGRASAYLNSAEGAELAEAPQGCDWVVNESWMPVDEALLYRALKCGSKTTKLDFASGAQTAEITYAMNALSGEGDETVIIRMFSAEEANPQGALNGLIYQLSDAEKAVCEIRLAGIDGWPADALVIAPNAAARAALPQDEPAAACGPYGLDEDAAKYWRITQGYAWFYDLGQDLAGFDPNSLTVIKKSDDGGWFIKE